MSSYAEYGTFGFGGVAYPLVADSPNELLRDADPALYYAADFLTFMLRANVEPRLVVEGQKHGLSLAAVRRVMAYEPAPNLITLEEAFPLFAIYRKAEVDQEQSLAMDRDVSTWEYAYLLPHFAQEREHEKLSPILRTVSRTIKHAVRVGQHPDYADGANVWKMAGIQAAKVVRTDYRPFVRKEGFDAIYRAVVGRIEVIERETPVVGAFPPMTGAAIAVGVQESNEEPPLYDLEVDLTFNPRIDSVIPATGPGAGGTQIYVYGGGFREGATISIDGVECTATVLSENVLSALTPPHSDAPPFFADVVITNDDGASGRKPAAFLYTP